jgi:hypothetical protein
MGLGQPDEQLVAFGRRSARFVAVFTTNLQRTSSTTDHGVADNLRDGLDAQKIATPTHRHQGLIAYVMPCRNIADTERTSSSCPTRDVHHGDTVGTPFPRG